MQLYLFKAMLHGVQRVRIWRGNGTVLLNGKMISTSNVHKLMWQIIQVDMYSLCSHMLKLVVFVHAIMTNARQPIYFSSKWKVLGHITANNISVRDSLTNFYTLLLIYNSSFIIRLSGVRVSSLCSISFSFYWCDNLCNFSVIDGEFRLYDNRASRLEKDLIVFMDNKNWENRDVSPWYTNPKSLQ